MIRSKLDHLMIEAPSAASARAWAEAAGLQVRPGGSHPGRGTCNLLASLHGGIYLELLTPDADQPPTANSLRISRLERPRLAAACLAHPDLDSLARDLRNAGAGVDGPAEHARQRPDGLRLCWRLVFQQAPVPDAPMVFFIDWGDTPHPSADGPPGGGLRALWAEHGEPAALSAFFGAVGLDLDVRRGASPAWRAELEAAGRRIIL